MSANPLADPKLDWAPPKDQRDTVEAVDPRVVGSKEQITGLLAAVSYIGRRQGLRFRAFFGCLYYGMLRPEEATCLAEDDCELPESGWGVLHACATRSPVGRTWTDTGEVHDVRGPKHRSRKDTRPVPIPPELVAMLRWHIQPFGVARTGGSFAASTETPYIHSP